VASEHGPRRTTIHRPFSGDGTRPPIQVKRTIAGTSFLFKFVENLLLFLEIRLHWSLINDEMNDFAVVTAIHHDGYHGIHLPHATD